MTRKFPLSFGACFVAIALQAYAEEQTTLDTVTVNATEVKANQIKKLVKLFKKSSLLIIMT